MVGLYISNLKKNNELILPAFNARYIRKRMEYKEWDVQALFLDKFIGDKLFFENEEYIIMTDGVILNSKELCRINMTESFVEYILAKLDNREYLFWKEFRGSFSGAFFIKKEQKWYCFVSQIGDRPLFFYQFDEKVVIASSIKDMTNNFISNKINMRLNEKAVYNLLSYGFMQDSETLFENVLRLRAGQYCVVHNNVVEVNTYHEFDNSYVLDVTEDEIIELIDEKFRKAVKLEYEKDLEYGYKHIASLSGGLDARMSVWVASELGFEDIHTCTFCQSGYLDEIIAAKIAGQLRTNHMFKSLDDGRFLKNLDAIANVSYGIVDSSQIMHSLHMMDNLDFSNMGIFHTGQIGDVVLGSFSETMEHVPPRPFFKSYSSFMRDKNLDDSYKKYNNLELYAMYTRGFQGALGSQIVHNQYTEMFSAFSDVDFFEFCFSIPLKYRVNEEIYKKWIIKKFPEAAKIEWERVEGKITDNEFLLKVRRKIKRICMGKENASKYQMNPYDMWYNKYDDIRDYIDSYFDENITSTFLSESLREDLTRMFNHVSVREKIQVLTVLSVVKNYF